jgi:hypothetical protein
MYKIKTDNIQKLLDRRRDSNQPLTFTSKLSALQVGKPQKVRLELK